MKYSLLLIIVIGNFSTFLACPTCVGKVTPSTVPFFSSEFYAPGKPHAKTSTEYGIKEFKKLLAAHKEKK